MSSLAPSDPLRDSKSRHLNRKHSFSNKTLSIIFSFTREKIHKMLEFIIKEPASDADKTRGHAIPFHSDMIFQYNKSVINAKFFLNEDQ